MASLIEQSLVRLDERGGEPRYAMLQTVDEFAAEQLAASGEGQRLREVHAEYVLAMAESDAGPASSPDLPNSAWVDRLERDHDNLRAAMTWWLERGDAAHALRLAAAAGRFWRWRGEWAEGRSWLERALALAPDGDLDPSVKARAIAYAGGLARSQGEYRAAIAILEPGLAIPQTPESEPWLTQIALRLAQAYSQVNEFAQAMMHYERALALASATNDRYVASEIRWSMAYVANSQGDAARAKAIADEVLAHARAAGDAAIVAAALELLTWIALSADDLDGAAARLAEAWRAIENVSPRPEGIRANLLVDEAILAYRRDDFAKCAAMVGEWLPRARTLGSLQRQILALLVFASIASRYDRSLVAARWFGALDAALVDSEHGMHQEPAIRPWHEADIARVRAALGQESFDQTWAAGERVPLDDALEEAELAVQNLVATAKPGTQPDAARPSPAGT